MNAQQITQVQAVTGLYRMINSASLISVNENSDALAVGQFIDDYQRLIDAPVNDVPEVNRRYTTMFNSAKALVLLMDAERVQIIASYNGGQA